MLISWNTTRLCHLKCAHCYREAGEADAYELTTDEGKTLIDQIAKAGFKMLILSGGEPLHRPDILELTAYASHKGLRAVFGTTGTTIDLPVARSLKEAGALCMGISLDSKNAGVHDAFRGVEGAWQKAIQGMKFCAEAGLPFQVNTTVVTGNYHEIEELTDLAEQLGARAHHVFFLVPTGRGKEMTGEMLTPEQYEKLLQRILKKQRTSSIELKPTCAPQFMRLARQLKVPVRFTRGCLAGHSYCCILPEGDVHPCPYLPVSVGNVRETAFDIIWKEADLFRKMRRGNLEGKCGECEYKEDCGGCRARAYYQDGNILGQDGWCLYRKGRKARA